MEADAVGSRGGGPDEAVGNDDGGADMEERVPSRRHGGRHGWRSGNWTRRGGRRSAVYEATMVKAWKHVHDRGAGARVAGKG
jgi:hypothetical protein